MSSIVSKKLAHFVLPVKSVNPSAVYGEDEFQYFDIASVDRENRSVSTPQTLIAGDAPSRARQLVQTNDIIVSTVRPNLNTVAQVEADYDGTIASTGFCVLRTNPEVLDHRYLYHWISSQKSVDYLVSVATGASYPAVSDKIIKGMEFDPPPLEEQKRIAAILDKADSLRRKRAQAIALADDFLRAFYQEIVKKALEAGCKPKSLMDIFNFTTGKLDSNAAEDDGIYPFFTCAKETTAINTAAFDCEALLLAGNNANGDYSVKHFKGKFNAYQRTYVITMKNQENSYGFFRFALENQLKDLKRVSKGTNTKYLTLVLLAEQKLVEPPKTLQDLFECKYQKIEELKQKMLDANEQTKKLLSSLASTVS